MDSNEDSGSLSLHGQGAGGETKPSLKERPANTSKHGGSDRKLGAKGPGVMKDIDKLRMSKKIVDEVSHPVLKTKLDSSYVCPESPHIQQQSE